MDDSQIDYLLNHLGDSDASIRDGLVYSTLAQGFEESIFSEAQMRKIIAFVTDGECLYYKIGSQADDSVFLRSFSALMGAIFLDCDRRTPLLSPEQRKQWFGWAEHYLFDEQDHRGWVSPSQGWAHALAHGSDLLDAALQHPLFTPSTSFFDLISSWMGSLDYPFHDSEASRLSSAITAGLENKKFKQTDFERFLSHTDTVCWEKEEASESAPCYCLTFWINFLQSLYFLSNSEEVRSSCSRYCRGYYLRMGYLPNDR